MPESDYDNPTPSLELDEPGYVCLSTQVYLCVWTVVEVSKPYLSTNSVR